MGGGRKSAPRKGCDQHLRYRVQLGGCRSALGGFALCSRRPTSIWHGSGTGSTSAGTTFEKSADYSAATFGKWAYFQGGTFEKSAGFFVTTFEQSADFSEATFGEGADFGEARLEGANFKGARLPASISRAQPLTTVPCSPVSRFSALKAMIIGRALFDWPTCPSNGPQRDGHPKLRPRCGTRFVRTVKA